MNAAALTVPFAVSGDTQTTTTAVDLTVNSVITAFSSGPTVVLGAITPDSTGKQSTNSDTVSATTNDSLGLTIQLADNSATLNGLISGANTIATSAGTTGTPVTLVNNTWGWRVDSLAGFGAGPGAVISNAAPSAITYAAMPLSGAPFTIKTTAVTGSTSATVWYSARVNNTQATGAYVSTVIYTITTN
jgi:hypothetical protein